MLNILPKRIDVYFPSQRLSERLETWLADMPVELVISNDDISSTDLVVSANASYCKYQCQLLQVSMPVVASTNASYCKYQCQLLQVPIPVQLVIGNDDISSTDLMVSANAS